MTCCMKDCHRCRFVFFFLCAKHSFLLLEQDAVSKSGCVIRPCSRLNHLLINCYPYHSMSCQSHLSLSLMKGILKIFIFNSSWTQSCDAKIEYWILTEKMNRRFLRKQQDSEPCSFSALTGLHRNPRERAAMSTKDFYITRDIGQKASYSPFLRHSIHDLHPITSKPTPQSYRTWISASFMIFTVKVPGAVSQEIS